MAAAIKAIKKNADRRRKAVAKEEAARAREKVEEAEWQETTGTAPAPAPPVTPQRVEVGVPQSDGVDTTHGSGWRYFQPQARAMYEGTTCQVTVALIISANFLANVTEKEIDPQGINYPGMWRTFELTFNVIFLIELIVNMYARWLWVFWCDGWNIFDVVVVAVGCVSFGAELEGPLKLLRCLRAFRVFRLFKRVKILNRIIVMITAAIPGVTNAFLVIVIMISIYSLVAVEFFSQFGTTMTSEFTGTTNINYYDPTISYQDLSSVDLSTSTAVYTNLGTGQPSNGYVSNMTARTPTPTCAYLNAVGVVVDAATARNLCHGAEYWGTFTRSWFTLFQVLTGESWSEAIARPVLFGWADYGGASIYLSSIFFISFVLINAFILFNVFVAVLLDKVIQPEEEDDLPLQLEKDRQGLGPGGFLTGLTPGAGSPTPGAQGGSPGVEPSPGVKAVEMQVARTVFDKYDRDGRGTIDKSELGQALKSMNINVKDFDGVIAKYDQDKSGSLDFDEFASLLAQIKSMPPKTPQQMLSRLLEMQQTLVVEQRTLMAESQARAAEVRELRSMFEQLHDRMVQYDGGKAPYTV